MYVIYLSVLDLLLLPTCVSYNLTINYMLECKATRQTLDLSSLGLLLQDRYRATNDILHRLALLLFL